MIKFEIHCHTLHGSYCGLADADTIVKRYLDAGYGGLVVTNHYYDSAFEAYPGENKKEKLDFYFSLYEKVKEIGEKQGLRVLLGSEVKVNSENDYLLFGFDRKIFYDNKPLYQFTQEEMFRLAEKQGFFFAQAHPFRVKGVKSVGDPKLMHGIERFNGHFHHINNNEQAGEFCQKNNLIGLSGTDFHTPDQPITAGVFLPDYVMDEKQLANCLFNRNFSLYCDEKGYLDAMDKYYKGEWK